MESLRFLYVTTALWRGFLYSGLWQSEYCAQPTLISQESYQSAPVVSYIAADSLEAVSSYLLLRHIPVPAHDSLHTHDLTHLLQTADQHPDFSPVSALPAVTHLYFYISFPLATDQTALYLPVSPVPMSLLPHIQYSLILLPGTMCPSQSVGLPSGLSYFHHRFQFATSFCPHIKKSSIYILDFYFTMFFYFFQYS